MSSQTLSKTVCHGDYTKEQHLEHGLLYSNQSQLPTLPVPSLEETLHRFLPTALPLAENPLEVSNLEEAVAKFAVQATPLQQRLLERHSLSNDTSWLQHWWNTSGYLQVRDSVVINVSYYFHFKDDPTAMRSPAKRGAVILHQAAQYRNQAVNQTLPPETIGKRQTPLCMGALKYMFHSCRIPQLEQDSYHVYDAVPYAIVACRGNFYRMDISDGSSGEPLSVASLERGLEEILLLQEKPSAALGYLTSDNRDDWARGRAALLEIPGMESALETLESGAVLLCLDEESPVSREQCAKLFLYGNGKNRWFDKSIQIIVGSNGKAGLLGEHAMMDGMPMVGLANHVVSTTYQDASDKSGQSLNPTNVHNIFKDIAAPPGVLAMVEDSKQRFEEWTGKHEIHVQSFQGYGAKLIKTMGFSPDAFVQMAMQAATYRLFGKQVGTYEATQTRIFLHGRTETTRTVSTASSEFLKKFHDANATPQEKLEALQAAVSSHVTYIQNAANGMGVDRHFLGLSFSLKEGETLPDLFSDPVFQRSKRWRVSTSNLTHPKFDNWGYGEVVPDGVGLSYSVHPNHCMFSVTALKENEYTERLAHHLEEVMMEMRELAEKKNIPESKL